MSLNTSHTPDGKGVLIYNGEMILLYSSNVKLKFEKYEHPTFKGTKNGSLYLTSHRIIFMNSPGKDEFRSFSMPFNCLRDVQLEQPMLAPNYLKGWIQPLAGGNFDGCPEFRLSFPKGGCIEFGQALLRAAELASRTRPFAAPPAYEQAPKAQQNTYYSAPPAYYMSQGNYQGFQAPTHVFPEQPPMGNVYMFESPPPYAGIGEPVLQPVNQLQSAGVAQYPIAPPQPGFVVGAGAAPQQQPAYNIGAGAAPHQQPPYNIGAGSAPVPQPPGYGAYNQQPGYGVGSGVTPQQHYQNVPNSSQPPPYTPYQEAGPLPSKNGPPM
ncbi:unnamed protein product [Caenorhabditis bovis]|uniref:GRAM domain-containing protein n=1 Tax=Caenorhabditis bovis TaxID=2654633 RepID=A0A8S1EF93_9PELO|nr:unnamed protein product [Caenorhabditis bovis]